MKQACIFWLLLALGMSLGVIVEICDGSPSAGSISGQVMDAVTRDPLDNVAVILSPSGRQTSTGPDGWYTIEGVPSGTYNVTFSGTGYERKEIASVHVGVKQAVVVSVSLLPVQGSRDKDYKSEVSADSNGPREQKTRIESEVRKQSAPPASSGYLAPKQNSYSGNYQEPQLGTSRMPKRMPYEAQVPQDMYFRDYGTHDFVSTSRDRFSTFGLDVDDASYTLARSYLNDGNLPPTDAIRVEEFVNHFNYGYNTPSESKFRIFTELTSSPYDRGVTIMKIGIKGREISDYQRKTLNLTLVIDVSGSMQWGNRLELLKQSIAMLVQQLSADDQVAIVAYGSEAFEVLEPTPGNRGKIILRALDRLHAGGSTYAEAGIRLGYEIANKQFSEGDNNVVALCSDGVANVGETSPQAIMRDVKRFARKGITLSTFGVGMGNYNDVLLEQLAKQGNGKYAYIDTPEQAQKLFVDELVGTIQVLARDAKVQVEFNPTAVKSYRLIGYENRAIADQKFRDNKQDGGEIGAGHEVTALYELVIKSSRPSDELATVFVRWKDANQTEVTEVSQEVTMERHSKRFETARPELRLAIVAARFAEMLKMTEYSGSTSYAELERQARQINRQLPNEQTQELVSLIDRAVSLSGFQSDDNYYRN